MSLRSIYRRTVPERIRRGVRLAIRETPIRLRDAIPDLRDHFAAAPLPPASMRSRVGIDSSRGHFRDVGAQAARDIIGIAATNEGRWLDFGCGSGRVAWHVANLPGIALTGVDIDAPAVRWCAEHLRGDFRVIDRDPPMPFADGTFDVVYSVSVFTHFDEETQFRWLAELRRVLRDGGLLVATTHSPELTYNRPDLTRAHHEELAARGFTFIRGTGEFNLDSAFHAAAYLERAWSRHFELIEHRPSGLNGYQDLSLWRAAARP